MEDDQKTATERTADFIADPASVDLICDHVTMGGTLTELCESMKVKYPAVYRWLFDDKERRERWNAAVAGRGEWMIERVLAEIKLLATVDLRLAYDKDGRLLLPNEMPAEVARALCGIEVDEIWDGSGEARTKIGETKKVKLYDKLKALELLGKNVRMFVDRVELKAGGKLEDLVNASREIHPTPPHDPPPAAPI